MEKKEIYVLTSCVYYEDELYSRVIGAFSDEMEAIYAMGEAIEEYYQDYRDELIEDYEDGAERFEDFVDEHYRSNVLWSFDDDMKYVTFAVVPTELN